VLTAMMQRPLAASLLLLFAAISPQLFGASYDTAVWFQQLAVVFYQQAAVSRPLLFAAGRLQLVVCKPPRFFALLASPRAPPPLQLGNVCSWLLCAAGLCHVLGVCDCALCFPGRQCLTLDLPVFTSPLAQLNLSVYAEGSEEVLATATLVPPALTSTMVTGGGLCATAGSFPMREPDSVLVTLTLSSGHAMVLCRALFDCPFWPRPRACAWACSPQRTPW
jgi:hypothetical protein